MKFFEYLEPRALFSTGPTYVTADLAGPWVLAAMTSHGEVSFDLGGDISGTVEDDTNAAVTPTGTYVLSSNGTVSSATTSGVAGAMNGSKNFIAYATTGANSLTLLLDRKLATYASTDLSGSWNLFTNGAAGGAGDNSGYGQFTFDGVSAATGTYTANTSSNTASLTATYTLATGGGVNFTTNGVLYTGAMSSTKDVLLLSPDDMKTTADQNSSRMLVLMKRGASGTYSNADLTGTWVIAFDGGTGTLSFDGKGKIVGGTVTNSGGVLKTSGTYTVKADGTFSTSITTKSSTTGTGTTKFSGAVTASRDVAFADRPADVATGSDDLLVMVRAGSVNHIPTLTKVAQLKTAEAGSPFTITYAQLATAANEADVDGDPLSFSVDSLGAGTLTKDGAPVTAGTLISTGESVVWTPLATAKGAVTAFSIKAWDGAATSATALPVKVTVTGKSVVSVAAGKSAAEAPLKASSFTVSRASGSNAQALTVTYTISGTATNGVDYGALSGTVVIPAGKPSAAIALTPVNDNTAEPSETVVVTLDASDAAYVLNTSKKAATVTITDGTPTVSVSANRAKASETNPTKSGKGQFTLKRAGGDVKTAVTVQYAMTGTATNGDDYTLLSGTVTFAAGKSSVTVDLVPVSDALTEGSETAVLTLVADPSYRFGNVFAATVTIADG